MGSEAENEQPKQQQQRTTQWYTHTHTILVRWICRRLRNSSEGCSITDGILVDVQTIAIVEQYNGSEHTTNIVHFLI